MTRRVAIHLGVIGLVLLLAGIVPAYAPAHTPARAQLAGQGAVRIPDVSVMVGGRLYQCYPVLDEATPTPTETELPITYEPPPPATFTPGVFASPTPTPVEPTPTQESGGVPTLAATAIPKVTVTPISSATPDSICNGTVIAGQGANVRRGPGVEYEKHNTGLPVHARTVALERGYDTNGNAWYRIIHYGDPGWWIAAWLVRCD